MTPPKRPETPAEKEMKTRNLPETEVRGEELLPLEDGSRHPRHEGKGGLPDPGDDDEG